MTAEDLQESLAAVRSSVLHLLTSLPRRPARLRVQAGEVSVEAEWRAGEPAPPATAAAGLTAPAQPAAATAAPATTGGTASTSSTEPATATTSTPTPGGHHVRAPSAGCFYRSPEPGAPPFVEIGDSVVAGQQVAIVEAMKLMIPVNAEVDGRVADIHKQDGDDVDHGDPLITLLPITPSS